MEPINILFGIAVALLFIVVILAITTGMLQTLTKVEVKPEELSPECVNYCFCDTEAECLTVESCTWSLYDPNKPEKGGFCKSVE